MTHRKSYSSDLSNGEWQILEPLLPAEKPGGRHRLYSMREVINAIQYVLRNGCAWRNVPHDLPQWETAYHYFQRWKKDGTWLQIHDHLHAEIREKMGREMEPSAAIIDSQSVKTTEKGGSMVMTEQRK